MALRLGKKETGSKRTGFSLGVGTVVFLAVLLYIIVSLVLFLTSRHIEYYQVVSGPLARNHTYTGIALRSEQIVTSDTAGYVTYYAQGNARIKKAGMLFGIGASRTDGMSEGLTAKAKRGVYESVRSFASGFDSIEYHDVYSLKYDVTGKLVSDTPILSSEMQAATLHSQGTYTLGSETITASPKDGIVSIPFADGKHCLLQTPFLFSRLLFLFLFRLQGGIVRKEIQLLIGRFFYIFFPDDMIQHNRDPPDEKIRTDRPFIDRHCGICDLSAGGRR